MADAGNAPYQICYFKNEDRYPWCADFPTSISIETVRTALKKSGMLELRKLTKTRHGAIPRADRALF
jgi:hypothetical protein